MIAGMAFGPAERRSGGLVVPGRAPGGAVAIHVDACGRSRLVAEVPRPALDDFADIVAVERRMAAWRMPPAAVRAALDAVARDAMSAAAAIVAAMDEALRSTPATWLRGGEDDARRLVRAAMALHPGDPGESGVMRCTALRGGQTRSARLAPRLCVGPSAPARRLSRDVLAWAEPLGAQVRAARRGASVAEVGEPVVIAVGLCEATGHARMAAALGAWIASLEDQGLRARVGAAAFGAGAR